MDRRRQYNIELEALYHYAPVGLCLVDRELRFQRVNQRLADINGMPAEAHIGRTMREIVPALGDQAEALLRRIIDTRQPVLDFEVSGETPAAPGLKRIFNEHWWPVIDGQQEVAAINIAVEEITDRKRLEEELRYANRAKDEYLAVLSHELRAPLNTIVGWIHIIARSAEDPAAVRRGCEALERAARMQQTLIADMLDVSAIVAGKLRLDLRPVSVAETMHAAADAARAAADARRINLRIIVESDATILADSNRLHQVFWNLLSNAVKFTPPEGNVTATIRRTNGKVEVRVEDTGRGIPRAFLPHVFDRFRQQSSGDMGGLGLGLAIVRHLTERHGGNVWADSRGEGQGATFTVTLPVPSFDKPADEKQ